MAKIIFKGITRVDDPIFAVLEPKPANSNHIAIPENFMTVSLIFALPLMALSIALIFVKRQLLNDFPMVRSAIPIGIALGILCCFVHEFLHAVVQPKYAVAYIGLIPAKFMFYMKCSAPISRGRFILMSLLPVILGIVPMIIFIVSKNQVLNSIMWPMGMIGLISPSPDYLNVYTILRTVPKNAVIQDDEDGLCWVKI